MPFLRIYRHHAGIHLHAQPMGLKRLRNTGLLKVDGSQSKELLHAIRGEEVDMILCLE